MGYVSKDIAVITEPKILTLSASPNFVQFASKPALKTYLELNLKVNISNVATAIPTKTILRITEPSGAVHAFHGTTVASEVGGSVFFVSANKSDTAENLRQALLANRWINANFEIRIPFIWVGGDGANGETLNIKSKGAGTDFNINVSAPNNTSNVAYQIIWLSNPSVNNDSISGEASTVQIELDVYENGDTFLGGDDRPITAAKLGTHALTMQKTYAGVPLWFELNAIFSQYAAFNRPPLASGWFNTGTARTFRFIAKVRAVNSFAFYQSNALYVLNGYGPASEALDLEPYTLTASTIKLLTNKPRTNYVRGQREYLNFIFRDLDRDAPNPTNYALRIAYRVYSASDAYITTIYGQPISRGNLSIVNTCVLAIDTILDAYPKAGIVRVALARGATILSNDLEYNIRPECLHELQQFTFLNRLGGWDSFNFDSTLRDEIKQSSETYNKTLTPEYGTGDSLETVYSTALANTFTVEGAPVSDAVAEWLKELAAARVVLNGDGDYIIKEDFTLNVTDQAQNMQVPTIKYRLSETYTND